MKNTTQQPMQVLEQHFKDTFMRGKPEIKLTADLPLVQSGVLDSLGLFKMVSFVEEQFNIKIAPNELNLSNFETLATIEQFILSKQQEIS